MSNSTGLAEFDAIRPHVMALLELHRAATTEEARSAVVGLLEDAFLATAWHMARDLVENGWSPGPVPPRRRPERPQLRLVASADVA